MARDARRNSDYICSQLLECVRFDPTSENDSYISAISEKGNGLGGVGYSYWRSHEAIPTHQLLLNIRRASSKEISLGEADELLDKFCSLHIAPLIAGRFDWQMGRGTLSAHITDEQRDFLKNKFFLFMLEFTTEKWYWAPLNSVSGMNYKGTNLIFADTPEAQGVPENEMSSFLQRPLFESTKKFAGIKARNAKHAKEKLDILLGALFLCMHTGTHYVHTMGRPSSGLLFFEHGLTLNSTRPYLPNLAFEIEIDQADLQLLTSVNSFLEEIERNKKIIRSLRWLSASWFTHGAERFSLMCQAIDALTPSQFKSMRAKCDWIYEQLQGTVAKEPINLLFKTIRSDVAHGDAPSLIESNTYLEFLTKYNTDPELAAIEIVRKVLVERFIPSVSIRPNPLLSAPQALQMRREIFARYGLDFNLSTGFSFTKLSEKVT